MEGARALRVAGPIEGEIRVEELGEQSVCCVGCWDWFER
jgi:hypothetical protein